MNPRFDAPTQLSMLPNLAPPSFFSQLARAVEYTDCFSAEGLDPPNESLGYDTKQSDGLLPVILELLGVRSKPSLPLRVFVKAVLFQAIQFSLSTV